MQHTHTACTDPLFAPAELLVALHALNPTRDGIPTKALIAAVDVALKSPGIFPQQTIAQVRLCLGESCVWL